MPAQPPGVWGIDLGQCGLKAIRLQEIDGQLVATAFDYVEHPKILSQPDADPDQLTREALDKFLSRNTLRGDIVAISVPGQSGLARFVKLPPVEEKKIADIVRFEAKQQIPFNLDEVVWDYQKIGSGAVTDGFAMETEIGLFAMKRDMVSRYLQQFKDVGVDVHLVQMAPLALCNYVAFDLLTKDADGGQDGDKRCVVALDIGADSSNLVITDGERIIWQRPIPLGGNHFTRALTKDLKLTFAKAEHLKRNATKSPDLKKILAALKPVLNDFVGEVQRSLGYFTNTHRDAHIEYMIGLGNAFRLPGLQKFLSEKLQIEVKKLGKMERVSGDQVVAQQAYTENVLTFAVAYGLALQGLKRARLLTNLLPDEIRVERLVKAKKPFAVAAAAALLLASVGLALSYGLEYRTYGHPSVVDAEKGAKSATDKASNAKTQFEAAKRRTREEEDAVRTIVAGQFERANWPELYKFIYTAVPRPDSSKPHAFPVIADDGTVTKEITLDNIPKEFEPRYWVPKGQQAYMEFLSQHVNVGAGKEEGRGDGDAGAKDLIQFNIESIQGFYCDNLSTFWDQVKNSPKLKTDRESLVRPLEQYKKNPEGSGWIIELHGWTYHGDKESFIKNTLLENLARLGIQEKKPEGAPTPGGPGPRGGPPGVPPASPGAPPGAMASAAGGQKEDQEPLGPVINHISHVVLYNWAYSAKDTPFEILDSTHEEIKALALGEAAGAGAGGPPGMGMMGGGNPRGMGSSGMSGPPMGGPPGGPPGMGMMGGGGGGPAASAPTTRSRAGWQPLEEQGEVSNGPPGMAGRGPGFGGRNPRGGGMPSAAMGPGGGSGRMPPGAVGRMPPGGSGRMMPPGGMPLRGMGATGGTGRAVPPRMPGMLGGQAGASDTTPQSSESNLMRTEFVILFIWKEPTDSDSLRGLTGSGQGPGAGTGGTPSLGGSGAGSPPPPRVRRPRGGGGGGRGGRQRGR